MLTACTCGTMVSITLSNLIAVPAIQIAYGWAYGAWPAGRVLAVTFVLTTALLPLVAKAARRF